MRQVIIISDTRNIQSEALFKELKKSGIKVIGLFSDEINNRITITSDKIIINNKAVSRDAVVFYTQFEHEFIPFPIINKSNDYTIFQDQYSKQEQLKSHLLSIGNVHAFNNAHVINNPFKTCNYYNSVFVLDLLKKNGIKTIQYVVTSNLKDFNKSKIALHNNFFWSYIIPNSPIKLIDKKNIKKLFDSAKDFPFLVFPFMEGTQLRMWFFMSEPIIGLAIYPPEYNKKFTGIEKYLYIKPHDKMMELGENLHNITNLDFYEVNAIVSKETGELNIININADPYFYSMEEKLRNYLILKLADKICNLIGLNTNREISIDESILFNIEEAELRITTLLKRMLETQLLIHQSEGKS